jgi:hypothetical protein
VLHDQRCESYPVAGSGEIVTVSRTRSVLETGRNSSMAEKRKYRRQRWSSPFFEALAKYGNVTTAAAVAGISRSMVYKALNEAPRFAAQFFDAIRQFRDSLHLRLTALAMKDDTPAASRSLRYPNPDGKSGSDARRPDG